MNEGIILPIAYLAPVEYFRLILQYDKIFFELFENYPKQTIRNRCYIYSANGVLTLSVPVTKKLNNFTLTKDIEISYNENWQKKHLRAIESAYNHSPYYEYYKDEFISFFDIKYRYLRDLNENLLLLLLKLCDINKNITYTESYKKEYVFLDCRSKFDNAFKTNETYNKTDFKYSQVFENKYGFIPDLSIIDLLFNYGPETKQILKSVKKMT